MRGADTECVGNQLQRLQGHALLASLQPIQVGPVQAGRFGELVLRESLRLPQFRDAFPHHGLNIRLQSIRLWAYAALKNPALKQHRMEFIL